MVKVGQLRFSMLALVTSMAVPLALMYPQTASGACTNWAGLNDNDCDGLADTWETTGYDVNGDSVIDLNLAALGANPNHKDIFLEIDYMQFHQPRTDGGGVVNHLVAAFANAPLTNPDSINGITLHVQVDNQIPHQDSIAVWTEFDTLKDTWFGTSAERTNPNHVNILAAKQNTYHYSLWVHTYGGSTSSGISELPGNDLVVSLGYPGWGVVNGHTVGSVDEQEGTLMHELGHNLGLRHGGNVDENCKPNYLSVMSYSFQFSAFVSTRPLDYSRSVLNLGGLNENSLSEPVGITASTPAGLTTVYGPTPLKTRVTGQSFDWNRDGDKTDTGVVANVNNIGIASCNSGTLSPLFGFNDWPSLQYWGTVGGWSDGADRADSGFGELTINDVRSSRLLQLESIISEIQGLHADAFKNPASSGDSKVALKQALDAIKPLTKADKLDKAIEKLNDVKTKSKSILKDSANIEKLLDNAINAFEKQM